MTDQEKFIIEKMVEDGSTEEEIAKFLGKTVRTIKKYVPTGATKSKNKREGIAVMTEALSQRGDALRNKINKTTMNDAIYKPKK